MERESITGVWAEPPAGSRGRAPGRGVRGAKPPEVETLFASECSMETKNSPIFGEKRTFLYKVACKKFSWSGQRGAIAPCPPLNMPLDMTGSSRPILDDANA